MKPLPSAFLLTTLALLGAGCAKPLVSPRIAEPLGEALVERPITQRKGFGIIPATPPPRLKPGLTGSVRLAAVLPTIPPDVTVLRVKSGRPNDPQLRNLAGLFSIPNGPIGAKPESRELTFDWRDERGLHWTYQASNRRLEFTNEAAPRPSTSVTTWAARANAPQEAIAFLERHGINRKRLGDPYVEPDWVAWWQSENQAGRCMTTQSVIAIRSLAAAPFPYDQIFPILPSAGGVTCVNPEFPGRLLVRFNALQDGQGQFREDGAAIPGASLALDAKTGEVLGGWVTLPVDPDRSDYPGITADEMRQRLLSGGQGGTPRGDVTITKVTFEWYETKDTRTPQTTYLYPALVGHGTISYENGTTAPYRIVVPLVKNEN